MPFKEIPNVKLKQIKNSVIQWKEKHYWLNLNSPTPNLDASLETLHASFLMILYSFINFIRYKRQR